MAPAYLCSESAASAASATRSSSARLFPFVAMHTHNNTGFTLLTHINRGEANLGETINFVG